MLSLNTNIASLFAANSLNATSLELAKVQQRLSTGKRINTAEDDPTGLVIATNLDTQVRGTNVAIQGAQNAVSTATTNDGYAAQIIKNLQRLNEIAVQSGGTAAGAETTALLAENARIAGMTTATGNVTVDGKGTQVAGQGVVVAVPTGVTVAAIAADLTTVTNSRSLYGADMARFGSAVATMQTTSVNLSAAYSRIMDTNYAADSAEQAKLNILQQAGTAILAQANQMPNSILALLR